MQPKPADDLDIVDELLADDEPRADEPAAETKQPEPDPAAQALLEELKQLREELSQVQQPAETNPAGNDEDPPLKIEAPEIDDKQLGKLAAHRDNLEKIAKKAAADDLKAVAEQVNELKAQIKQLRDGVKEQAKATFAQQLRIAVPDIDQLHQTDDFKEYLKKPAPMSGGRTIGSLLAEAYEQQDLARVQEIINEYRRTKEPAAAPASVRPPVSGLPSYNAPSVQGSPESDLDALDQKYVKVSQTLLGMYRRKELDDAAYQEKVSKLRRRYEEKLAKIGGGGEALAL